MTDPVTPAEDAQTAPVTAPATYTGRIRLRTSELARVGLIVGCLVVLIASAAVASGASPAASPDGAGASPAATAAPGKTSPFGKPGGALGPGGFLGRLFGQGGPGGHGDGGRGFGFGGGPSAGGPGTGGPGIGRAITITAIAGSDVSLKTDDGWTRTITVTDKTEIRIGSQKAALADLKVGDNVSLNETKNTDGTYTVTLVVVRVPSIGGTVTAVTSAGFTVKLRDGSSKTVTVSSSTDYQIAGSAGAKADVVVGSRVQVEGTVGTGDAFSATVVHIAPDVRAGTVTDATATTITIKTRDGSTSTIHVDGSTKFRVAGATTATAADVKTGMVVMVQGTARADGSLDAISVFAGDFKAPNFHGPKPAAPSAAPSLPAG
jgi:hypothetical protein